MKTWQLTLGRHRSSREPREPREGDLAGEARAEGIQWADREAEGLAVLGAWPFTWVEALPFVRPCREAKTRRNLASIANDAAERRWTELSLGSLSLAA